jgi:3-dehydroquinate synthase
MRTLTLDGRTGSSRILVGGSLRELDQYFETKQRIIVTDANVRRHWGALLKAHAVLEVGLGEQSKTLETVARLYDGFLEAGADRATFIVAVGGGIVCDIAGFAATTYLRGLRFGFVPSTLLAQVDASVGGKNGVNLHGYKNLVGAIRQPELVVCDFELLRTLPEPEVRCGLAEVVKVAAIADAELFGFLEDNASRLLKLQPDVLGRAVHDAIRIKRDIVASDETEQGPRALLNFGHTFGHAIEKTLGLPHGEAVSVGMVMANDIAAARGLLTAGEAERVERLLARLGLPTRVSLNGADVLDALGKDKKRFGHRINAILLDRVGHATICPIAVEELGAYEHPR